ncbi:MAG: fibrillarin-like rRNA/tRNA 2'-O-methyltransferase [Methanobacteriota archaeon]|nr:MAG: fibrillarin-like rRNA/tRNA 2'-O-methyltransferase [Euryarchaeota archaeon]
MEIQIAPAKKQSGVFRVQGIPGVQLATQNAVPGIAVYGERLFSIKNREYREFSHKRSKIASSILSGLKIPYLKPTSRVLYLGASTGTTVSHLSDILTKGVIFAVEFAPRPMRDLLEMASLRENIIPIHGDARYPEQYSDIVDGVDFVFCDVAQPNQSELFLENVRSFLKPGGGAMIAVKSRSISQAKSPDQIFSEQREFLEKGGLLLERSVNISKYHKDHEVFLFKWN